MIEVGYEPILEAAEANAEVRETRAPGLEVVQWWCSTLRKVAGWF
jgi:hypothetical protein